jgi:hypothetical protein
MTGPHTAPSLTPANPSEALFSLSYALTHDGKRRFGQANNLMAVLTAHHLLEHLERSGFVVMKKPPVADHAALVYSGHLTE